MADGQNFPTIADLVAAVDRGDLIVEYSLETLEALQADLDNRKSIVKRMEAVWKGYLRGRFEGAASVAFQMEKKDSGTVAMASDQEPYIVSAQRTKRVDWDQAMLADLRQRIITAGEDASLYMKAEYKIAEATWTGFSDPIRAAFAPARTVKPAETVFTIKRKE